jgi:hypothetical protein
MVFVSLCFGFKYLLPAVGGSLVCVFVLPARIFFFALQLKKEELQLLRK